MHKGFQGWTEMAYKNICIRKLQNSNSGGGGVAVMYV